jgi:hypothetical protein
MVQLHPQISSSGEGTDPNEILTLDRQQGPV